MLVEAEIWTVARTDKGNAVLVKPLGSEQAVPIFIGQLEAQSILFGLASVPVPRPMTHDLFISVMEKTGITVERIEITDLQDRTFYARIILKQGIKKLTVDARPSDALGIASRLKCPVYIAEAIVDEAGVAVSLVSDDEIQLQVGDEEESESAGEGETEGEIELPQEDDEKSRLRKQLERAVEEENYEEAARIRDLLNEIQ